MKPEYLVDELLAYSQIKHPTYNDAQHRAWVMGVLARIVLNKSHMDNHSLAPLLAILDRSRRLTDRA